MAQQIIDVGAAPDDGQGDTLREGFIKTNENFTAIFQAGPVDSYVRISNNQITTTATNLDLLLNPNGIGKIRVTGDFSPSFNNVYEIGAPEFRFNTAYIGSGGADVLGPITARGNLVANIIQANNVAFSNVSVSNNVTANGNVTGGFIIGDGRYLSNVVAVGTNIIENGNSNVVVDANSSVRISTSGVANVAVFSANVANFDTDVVVSGNLTVDGNVTYINITSLEVEDPIISLGRGPNNTPLTSNDHLDRGTRMWHYTTQETSAFVGYQNATNKIIAAVDVSIANEIVTVNNFGTVNIGNLEAVGNVSANYVIGNGTVLTSVMTDRGNDSSNYDTLVEMGVYKVNRVSWSGVTGAPTDSMITVGLLEVMTSGNTTVQSFFPGQITTDVKIQYDRSLWNGIWTPWVRLTNVGQQIEGGTY